jgi:signal transduction histidine kinase
LQQKDCVVDYLQFFHSPQKGRLVRHYFLASTILIGVGLITSGALEVFFRHRESWELYALIQKEITAGAAFKIEQFIQEIQRGMRAATKTTEVVQHGLAPEFQRELRRLLVNSPAITEAVAFDLNGIQRAAARRSGPILAEAKWEPPTQAALEKVKQGKPYFGAVYFSEGGGAFMKITVPIERFVGEVVGILQSEIDLTHVREVISAIQVGKTGHAYLVTRSGDLIAHGDLSLVIQKRNLAYLNQVGVAIRSGSTPSAPNAFVTQNIERTTVFTSHILIPGLDWLVFTEQPIKEVYAPLYASMLRTSGVLCIGLGVALLASFFVGRRVVRPLQTLRQGVERIGSGDLSARLEIKTGDEIEILAAEFNKMTAHLKEAQTGLERKVAERTQALTIANEKLAEASKLKSRFLANVNHELRTPVSAIIGYGRLVLRATEGQIAPLQRENLQDLLNNAERLLHLVDGLLDFAKIEAGKMEVRVEPVSVDKVIHEATLTIEPILNHDSVRLIREIAPDVPALKTDREKLRQIILNLLDNAVKFTERGEIRISASQQNGSLKLIVSDTGIGIEKEDLNQIFEEFNRGDLSSTKKYRGTGLGLAIVKKFVHLLGGEIAVESEVGKGSTFTVMLPLDHRLNRRNIEHERQDFDR